MKVTYPWHAGLLTHVEQQFSENRLPHAMLFRCRRDFFDDMLGWEISKLLLCEQQTGADNCKHCVLATEKSHPNVLFLDVMNDKVGIDDVRALEQQMWQTSVFDKPKVAFISGMDLLSIAAQNALLKTLEEPPKNTFFVLSVENISRVLPTIMSRVQRLYHSALDSHDLLHWLQRELGEGAPTEAAIAKTAKLADNAPQQALALLNSPDRVAELTQEKQQFVAFLSGKASATSLLAGFSSDNATDVLTRFCRYTEGMIRFLFEKSLSTDDKSGENSLQYPTWNGVSLRAFYRLLDVLRAHRKLVYTNVNMTMQLTTHLVDWQNDRRN